VNTKSAIRFLAAPSLRVSARVAATCCALLVVVVSTLATGQMGDRQALQTQAAAPPEARLLGRLPASQPLHLAISLPLRNHAELKQVLHDLYDPASPNYHRFLSVKEFTERFGPTEVDCQRVVGFAQSNGLRVTHTFANRLVIDASGPAASVERAFQVTMQMYQHPTENRTFFAPDVEPSVDAGLPILSVEGLSTFSLPHSMLKRRSPEQQVHSDATSGSGPGGQFLGSDMRAAYGGGTSLDGSGQAVGLIELGPYRIPDVLNYFSSLSQPLNVPITNVLVGVNGICGVGCDDGEEAIDIQQAISMAPNLSAMIVYITNGASTDALSAYTQAATDNIAKQLSLSFGWGGTPSSESGYEQVFEELEAQGTSSFVASGDAGANVGGGGYPGNSTNITDSGGTHLTTATPGGAWQSEIAWSGSGGGWNTAVPIPTDPPDSWSQGAVLNASNGGDPSYRNIPDVAAEADFDNYFCSNGTCQGGIAGTSLSSPRWAAFVALINQQAVANATSTGTNPTLGFVNSTFYPLGQGSSYNTALHDITSGNNANGTACTVGTLGCLSSGVQGFNAVTGFDIVTGWGSPNGPGIFDVLAPTSSNANFSLSASPSALPLTPGGQSTSTITLTALHGFNAATNLSVVIPGSGSPNYAPAGLTANLSANSIAAGGGSVMLNVSTTSATPGGTYVIGVVGTSGSLTQIAYVAVELPAFVGVTATPGAGLLLNQGGSGVATVTTTGINGFNGTVTLTPSSVPTGITDTFATVNATTSTATFNASSTAPLTGSAKPDTIIVTGSATGSASQSAGINLFVASPLTGGAGTPVNLSSAYNVHAVYTDADESAITATNSLDGVGYAFSANLLGTGLNYKGTQFTFGPANQANAVYGTGTAITLPTGSYTALQMLATGIEGNQASQTITVTYTDSSTQQFTQSFSDWCSALNGNGCASTGGNTGESVAVPMPYRDSAGGQDDRVFYLYGYSFALNSAKTVQSVTLPNNRDVVVLAISLTAPAASYSLSAGGANPSSINAGSSSMVTVTVTPANSYAGTVTLSCAISPVVTGTAAPTCSFGSTSPVSVTSGAATATLTFTTVGTSGAVVRRLALATQRPEPEPQSRFSNGFYAMWLLLPGIALLGISVSSRESRNKSLRRKLLGLLVLSMLLAGVILIPACGGGNSGGGGGGGTCAAAPSVPTGLAASSTTSSGTTLTWTASTVGANCTLSSYTIYENGTQLATSTGTTYNVTGLSPATQYNFTVAASDSAGASAQSSAASVTTLSNGTPSGTYTITITGKDANGVAQSGAGATVSVVVN
jgi:Pro-kumamolisin, activation domain/Fibronectin type III domain